MLDLDACPPNPARIALIGCGVMGTALGHRLLNLGYQLSVYNRTTAKTRMLATAGAMVGATPQEAALDADILLTVVTDDTALRTILFGPQGVLMSNRVAPFVIDLGTHNPQSIVAIASEARMRGAHFIEAPVTGSVHDAEHGTLNFLVGAETEYLHKVKPFLEKLGRSVFHFGLPGSGNAVKLALNLLVGAMTQGLSEAIALLNTAHLDVASFLQALDGSGLSSPLYRRIGERYVQNDFATRFSLANLEKDMLLARDYALTLGLMPMIASTMTKTLEQIDAGYKERDYSALISWYSRIP